MKRNQARFSVAAIFSSVFLFISQSLAAPPLSIEQEQAQIQANQATVSESQFQKQLAQFLRNRLRESDMSHNAASEKGVFEITLCAVDELVDEHEIAGFVFCLERADRAGADDPCDPELFHGPDIGAMIQFARHDAMSASVPGQEHDLAPREFAGEKIVRGRAERGFDLDPFLVGETFNVVKSAAANNANSMTRHGAFYTERNVGGRD